MYKYGIFTPNVPVLLFHMFMCDVYIECCRDTRTNFFTKMKKLLVVLPVGICRMRAQSKLSVISQDVDQNGPPPNTLQRLAALMHAIWNRHASFLDRLANPYVPVAQEDEAELQTQHFTHYMSVSKMSGG
jgi:hypothetical protein